MDQGCPTVKSDVGRTLLQKIEDARARLARLKVLAVSCKSGALSETQLIDQYAEHASDVSKTLAVSKLFPEVPLEIASEVPGVSSWDVHQLPFNRHLRRKVQLAKITCLQR